MTNSKNRFDYTGIKELSSKQKQIKNKIDNNPDPNERKELRKERNQTLTKLHKLVRNEEKAIIESQIEAIENTKDDSCRMFQAIKDIKRSKPKEALLIKTHDGTLTADPKKQCELIAEHFQHQFYKSAESLPDVASQPMKTPFTRTEIKGAVKKLKNNKSAGMDDVVAELIKYGPDLLYDEIAVIFNSVAETGECPREIVFGILCALQKPGKSKGPLDHLRPIILLSMLRKILAICIRDRTIERIDAEIPPSQAAYRKGRSTTEHVFATKILCEKAVTSLDFKIFLKLIDMSKAFDTIKRRALIKDLQKILDPDEVHIIRQLLDVKLSVRCEKEDSEFFPTDTGVPQGDAFSANQFTFYLAKTLEEIVTNEHDYHDYPPDDKVVNIEMQYADDITGISSSQEMIMANEDKMTGKLSDRGLCVNQSKTENYEVYRGCDGEWKKCKLLGSKLDTDEDIKRRKGLAVSVIKEKKDIFNGNLDFITKMRIFNCYITAIFLYNSELWTLTETKLKSIDAFHRRLLRSAVLNIRWPARISNEDVYILTEAEPWSNVILRRQLSWFGHLMRLSEDTPARKALKIALEPSKRPRGRPPLTWIMMMKKTFERIGLTWDRAGEIAQDRIEWNNIIM